MDIKSLMIGDWVYNKHHGKNIRLKPYDFFTHTHNEFGEQELAPFAKPTIGKDLEPIPLTDVILRKNGFQYFHKNFCSLSYDHPFKLEMEQWPDENGLGGLWTICGIIEIRFVHQLQHALRLCGINKEIEL